MRLSPYRPSGVVAPLAVALPPSRASARLLRKSSKVTSPTVSAFRRSSTVAACEVKRALLDVNAPESVVSAIAVNEEWREDVGGRGEIQKFKYLGGLRQQSSE